MRHVMDRRGPWIAMCVLAAAASTPGVAHAEPVAIATCGDSSFGVTPATGDGPAKLHGLVVTGGARWRFAASVGLVRLGARTRTITVEDLTTDERSPARADLPAPGGLFIDLFTDDKKLILRHASEGAPDPAYAVDLDKCSFAGEAALAALLPPPPEPIGCTQEQVHGRYRRQVTQAQALPDADADREAQAVCEDHQKTIEARGKLEAAIADRAARDRIAARGPALMRTEDARMKAWNRIDGCLGTAMSNAHGVAALHDSEARTRACYAQIAAKP